MGTRAALIGLLVAQYLTRFGNGITIVAVPLYVLARTHSAMAAGGAGTASAVPLVIAGFGGGVLIDRLGLRKSSIVADCVAGLLTFAVPFLDQLLNLPLSALFALLFWRSLLSTPGNVARRGMLPEVSQRAGMAVETANTWLSLAPRLSLVLGPSVAGLLVAAVGAVNTLYLDAASFFVSAVMVLCLVPRVERSARERAWPLLRDIEEGVRFVFGQPTLRAFLVILSMTNLIDEAFAPVLFPVFALAVLRKPAAVGWLLAANGVGAVIGTLLYMPASARVHGIRFLVFFGCFGVVALCRLTMVALPDLWLALAMTLVFGFASGPLNPIINTTLQDATPERLRGRVFGAVNATAYGAAPVGIMLAGWLVGVLGLRWTFLTFGTLYFGTIATAGRSSTLRAALSHGPAAH